MPLPKQYSRFLHGTDSSRLVTFDKDSTDPFTAASEPKINGYNYIQLLEMHSKFPETYREILGLLKDSAFD